MKRLARLQLSDVHNKRRAHMKDGYYWARKMQEWEIVEVLDDVVWVLGDDDEYTEDDFEFGDEI